MGGGRFPTAGGGGQPQDFQPAEGMQPPPGGQGGQGGFGGHKLKERFLSSTMFKTVYEDAYRELFRKIFADGAALKALDSITKVLSNVGGYDAAKVTADVEQLRTLIRQRTEHLATDRVITGR
jgi:spore coat protein CotH